MATLLNIPLLPSEQAIIDAYETNYNLMSKTHDSLIQLLESKINSSPKEYAETAARLEKFTKRFKQFSDERSNLLSEILINRRTI